MAIELDPELDRLETKILWSYDSQTGLYRPATLWAYDMSEGGTYSHWCYFWYKTVDTGGWVKLPIQETDKAHYNIMSVQGHDGQDPYYYNEPASAPNRGGNFLCSLTPSALPSPITSTDQNLFYNLEPSMTAGIKYCLRPGTWNVIVAQQWKFFVNSYSQNGSKAFRNMRILTDVHGRLYAEAKCPKGIVNVNYTWYPDYVSSYDPSKNEIDSQPSNPNGTFNIYQYLGNDRTWTFRSRTTTGFNYYSGTSTPGPWKNFSGLEDQPYKQFIWPNYCKVRWDYFDTPTLYVKNNRITWTLRTSQYVQNGYDVYFDGQFYVNTKNTYVDIPDQYRFGSHNVRVIAKANSTTVNTSGYRIQYRDTSGGYILQHTYEEQVAYLQSSAGTVSYEGKLETPFINYHQKTAVNKYSIGWANVPFADSYETYNDDNLVSNINNRCDLTIHQGNHSFKIRAKRTINGTTYYSDWAKHDYYMPKINMPNTISFTKNVADGGSLYWTSVPEAEEYGDIKEYTVQVNGIEYHTNGNTYILEDLPIGTDQASIRANFGIDTTYSSTVKDYKFTDNNIIKKLATPNLNAYEIRDKDTNGVVAISLEWSSVSYASGYVLDDYYEIYNDESGMWEGTHIEDDLIANKKEIRFNIGQGVGKHTYKVKAYYKELINDFTSDYSNTPEKGIIEVSKLKPLKGLKWKSDDTNKKKDESTIRWSPVLDENYYRVFALKDGESGALDSKGYLIRSDGSSEYNFDLLNMSGVKYQLNTATYDIYIRCYNYDTLYFQPSEISNRLTYKVIQLDAPTGLVFDPNLQVLSWKAVPNATSYILYQVGEPLPIIETKETSYKFKNLGTGLYKFYIIAKRTVMEEE